LAWTGRPVLQVGFSCGTGWTRSRNNVVSKGILHYAPCDSVTKRLARGAPFRMTGGQLLPSPQTSFWFSQPSQQGWLVLLQVFTKNTLSKRPSQSTRSEIYSCNKSVWPRSTIGEAGLLPSQIP